MFLGHVNDLENGDKKPLQQFRKEKALVKHDNEYKLANNVCPHQGSLIISDTQQALTCQYHGWSWDNNGNPTGQGSTKICNNTKIGMKPVHVSNSLMFTDAFDFSSFAGIDLSYMKLVEERIDRVDTDYKNIIDVFLDVDHIPVVHPDVYDSIGVGNGAEVVWKYYDWGNIQLVERTNDYSEEYKSTLLGNEELAAVWVTIYPHTMIEWQPGALFITVCVPMNDYTNVVVYKYRDQRYSDKNWQLNNNIFETAWAQDKHQSSSIVKRSEFRAHLEESKIHFREWLNK